VRFFDLLAIPSSGIATPWSITMKRTTWVAASLTALLALACIHLPWPSGAGQSAGAQGGRAGGKHGKWEYAELYAQDRGDLGKEVSWASPARKDRNHDWKSLLKKLAGRGGKAEAEAVDVLNALGEQGWELVAVSETRVLDGVQIETLARWTFKRPK
jgi:hypothetical protein